MNNEQKKEAYESASEILSGAGFSVRENILVGNNYPSGKILSLSVYASPILMQEKTKEVSDLLGGDYSVWGNTNNQEILIEVL